MIQSLRTKVLLAIISITLVTTCAVTLVFYFKASQMIEDNYGQSLYSRVEQMGNAFDDAMQEVYYLSVQSSCDAEVLQNITEFKQTKNEEILEKMAYLLKNYKKRFPDIGSVYLVLPDEQIVVTSQDYPVYEKHMGEERIKDIKNAVHSAAMPVIIQDPLRASARFLSFINTVTNEQDDVVGYIMVNMEERAVYYKYLDSLYDRYASDVIIVNSRNEIVSTKNTEKMGQQYQEEKLELPLENGISNQKGIPYMGVYYQTKFSGIHFFMIVEKSAVLSDLNNMKYFLVLLVILLFSISLIPAYFITKKMYRPLKNLTQTMGRIGEGELEDRVEITTNDEIGSLSRDFNVMLDHINELIEQLVRQEMFKKDAELEALQYQITPHFMYNTLNSIKYAALIKGEKEIGGLIADFVELLQASINKLGTFVTLADELHLLQNYINLQKMRYEGGFTVTYEVDQDAQGCFMPRLLLQPIVENALLHGVDLKKGDSRIFIGAYVKNDTLYLRVEDNGRGMSEEQIQKLLENKSKKNSGLSGIGVVNVKERLRLYYEERGGISYESSGKGTKVNIFLPAYKDQTEYSI